MITFVTKGQFRIAASMLILLTGISLLSAQIANAASPVIVVAKWDSVNACVSFAYGAYDVDTYTRDALAGEWFSSDPKGSLRAGSVLIRSDAVYYTISGKEEYHNSVAGRTCPGVTSFYFNLRTSTFTGWGPGKGATQKGLANTIPNNQVTQNGGQVLLKSQNVSFFPVLQCHHDEINNLVAAGELASYREILTDPTDGLYRPNNGCDTNAIPNLTINQTYYGFTKSMANGPQLIMHRAISPPLATLSLVVEFVRQRSQEKESHGKQSVIGASFTWSQSVPMNIQNLSQVRISGGLVEVIKPSFFTTLGVTLTLSE